MPVTKNISIALHSNKNKSTKREQPGKGRWKQESECQWGIAQMRAKIIALAKRHSQLKTFRDTVGLEQESHSDK